LTVEKVLYAIYSRKQANPLNLIRLFDISLWPTELLIDNSKKVLARTNI